MACKDIQQNIEAYLDGELTLSDRRDFEEHLTDCHNCQASLDNLRQLNASIKKIGYVNRPAGLRRNIKHGLRDLSGEDSPGFGWTHLLGFGGASAAVTSITVWALMSFMFTTPLQVRLTDELVSAHVRSMMANHMTDIASSDRHTVKPWFNGKLDFSPGVKDFRDEGYPLVGGRLDYLQKQIVAALIYRRRAHIINLFIRKGQAPAPTSATPLIQQQGYQLVSWHSQGLHYTLVSDLNPGELQAFAQLLQGTQH